MLQSKFLTHIGLHCPLSAHPSHPLCHPMGSPLISPGGPPMSQSHHPQDQVPSSPVPNRLASYGLSFTLHPSAHPCVALSQSACLVAQHCVSLFPATGSGKGLFVERIREPMICGKGIIWPQSNFTSHTGLQGNRGVTAEKKLRLGKARGVHSNSLLGFIDSSTECIC